MRPPGVFGNKLFILHRIDFSRREVQIIGIIVSVFVRTILDDIGPRQPLGIYHVMAVSRVDDFIASVRHLLEIAQKLCLGPRMQIGCRLIKNINLLSLHSTQLEASQKQEGKKPTKAD
ncbi:hypothetical protein D3C76_684150 [compost metagenome]